MHASASDPEPVPESVPESATAPAPEAAPEAAKPRVTIVEDDLSLLNALAFALEADGYLVAQFTAAAPLLAAPPAADCLVIDLKLPDMDGLALIQALRRQGPQPRAILITTHPDERLRRAAAAADIEIVEKPLIGGELRRRIEAAVRRD